MEIEILQNVTGLCSKRVKGELIPFLTEGEKVKLISNTANDVLIVEKINGERYPVRIEKTSLWVNKEQPPKVGEQNLKPQELAEQSAQPEKVNTDTGSELMREQTQVLPSMIFKKTNSPKLKRPPSPQQPTLFG